MGFKDLFASKAKSLVGVDIGTASIKVVELKRTPKGGYALTAIGAESIPSDSIVDGVIIAKLPVAEAIDNVFKTLNIRNNSIATSISGHSVIVKKVTVPEQSDAELNQSIQWEAEQYIPFDISEVNVDYQVLRRLPDAKKIELILVAAKKEKITDHTSVVSMAGKTPAVVDLDAFALHNVYDTNYSPDDSTVAALLNIGASVMNINIQRGREFLFTRDINMGGNHYTEFLQREMGWSMEDAEALKQAAEPPDEHRERITEVLRSVSENLALEAEKTFDYFKTTTQSEDIDEIYISGGAARTPHLREYLEEKFNVPVQFLNPFKKIDVSGQTAPADFLDGLSSDFAVAVGLALRAANDR